MKWSMDMQRNDSIDILKGIGILLVVLGHTGFAGTSYIYLFHMAVFFMASGYFYKDRYSDSLKDLGKAVLKRIRGLWVPVVIWNTVYTLLNNLLIRCNIYTSDKIVEDYLDDSLVSIHSVMSGKDMLKNIIKGLFFAGHTELGGAFWFLRVLFYISVSYLCVDFILKRFIHNGRTAIICQGIVSVLFLGVGYFMSLKNIDTFALDKLFSCYCLYYLGMLMSMAVPKKWEKPPVCIVTAIVCFLALLGLGMIGTISLGNNDYVNPLFMLAASVLGWAMVYSVSVLLVKSGFLNKFFSLLGRNTMIIVIFHFLCFKPVNAVVAGVKGWPVQTVSGFPVSVNTGAWWILYTAVSVGLCLLIAFIWNRLKKLFVKDRAKA